MTAATPELPAGALRRALAAVPAPPLPELFAPLDRPRNALIRFVAPRLRALVVDREVRVAAVGALLLCSALISTGLVPLWFIAVGPLVWGVPHVVSDLRYLVARPGYHRRPALAVVGLPALAASAFFGLRAALLGAAAAMLLAHAPARRRAVGVAVIGALYALTAWGGYWADLFFVHGHNLVAFAIFWAWRRRVGRLYLVPIGLFLAFSALILAGGTDWLVTRAGLHAPWTGLRAREVAMQLTFDPHGPWPTRFLVLYAFGQSAHYVAWMRLIPEEERPSPTPRTFHQSFRALQADLGSPILWAALLGTVAFLVVAAFTTLGHARNLYIQSAFFHGYLELIAAAVFWAERRRL